MDQVGSAYPETIDYHSMEDRPCGAMAGVMAAEFGALLSQVQAIGNRMKRRMDRTE